MKKIDWNEFKATLIEHDERYVSIFEEIEREAYEETQREDSEDEFESRLLTNRNTSLRNRDRKRDFIMIKTYLSLIGKDIEKFEKKYNDCFIQRVKELDPDIPDEHIEVYRKTINPFEMMEYFIGMNNDLPEQEALAFVFLLDNGIFDLYDLRKRNSSKSK